MQRRDLFVVTNIFVPTELNAITRYTTVHELANFLFVTLR